MQNFVYCEDEHSFNPQFLMQKLNKQNNEELLRLREEEKKQEIEANVVHKSRVKKPSQMIAGVKKTPPLVTTIRSDLNLVGNKSPLNPKDTDLSVDGKRRDRSRDHQQQRSANDEINK